MTNKIKIFRYDELKNVFYMIQFYENSSKLYKGLSRGKWTDFSKRKSAYSRLISKVDKIIKIKRVDGYYESSGAAYECRYTKTLNRAIKIAEKLRKIPEIRKVVIHEIKY